MSDKYKVGELVMYGNILGRIIQLSAMKRVYKIQPVSSANNFAFFAIEDNISYPKYSPDDLLKDIL